MKQENADFIVIDLHGEITSENAMAHFFDGKATAVVGTHTHIPTADKGFAKGTAFQTDIGMCGDYNSVIGMDKQNSIMRFLKDKNAKAHFPAQGTASLSYNCKCRQSHRFRKSVERFFWGSTQSLEYGGAFTLAGIKHKKGRQDKERSEFFKVIERNYCCRAGAKDPETNPRLRSYPSSETV